MMPDVILWEGTGSCILFQGLFLRKQRAMVKKLDSTHSFASGFVPLDSVDYPDGKTSWYMSIDVILI